MPPPSSTGPTNRRHRRSAPASYPTGEAGAADGDVPSRAVLGFELLADAVPGEPGLPTTLSSVVENTTFGRAFQIWANSTWSGVSGLSSAVSRRTIVS